VDTETYWARTGTFAARVQTENATETFKAETTEVQIWFLGLVLTVMLVTGIEQNSKAIKRLLETLK
jgi:hypothetical protein